jgi:IS605 OrfB family transposase
LYQTQRDVASGKNAVIRALWAAEGAMFDEFVREHGRKPKTKKEWPDSKLNVYKIARTASPDISGAMAAVASRSAWKKWVQTRYDALVRQSCSPPHYRDTCPIPLRAKEVRIVKADDKASKDYMVDFTLRSGRGQRWRVRVQPRDAYQRTVLKNIANGTWKHGDAMIERDRKNRWHLKFSYKRFVQEKSKGKTAAINRGIRTFLACAVDDGERWIYDANDIIAYLKQIQTRRKKYQWDSKASARSGRGRKRILRPTKPLMDKAARWRATKCQTIARRLVRWLDQRGVKTLLVDDFSMILDTDLANERVVQLIQEWPYYQLEQRIRSCCEEAGIEVISLDPKYISQRCPSCGHTDEKNRDMVRWKLSCTKCKYREHLDIAAAKNLLGRDLSELSPKVAN